MNATLRAQSAYEKNHTAIRTPKSTEAQLLRQVTSELKKATSSSAEYPKLVDALFRNRRMWTTFAMSVADKDNELPSTLRAQLFYLAEFTDLHSKKVLNGEAKVDVLIEINLALLRGLTDSSAKQ